MPDNHDRTISRSQSKETAPKPQLREAEPKPASRIQSRVIEPQPTVLKDKHNRRSSPVPESQDNSGRIIAVGLVLAVTVGAVVVATNTDIFKSSEPGISGLTIKPGVTVDETRSRGNHLSFDNGSYQIQLDLVGPAAALRETECGTAEVPNAEGNTITLTTIKGNNPNGYSCIYKVGEKPTNNMLTVIDAGVKEVIKQNEQVVESEYMPDAEQPTAETQGFQYDPPTHTPTY